MSKLLGRESRDFFTALHQHDVKGLRANTLKVDSESLEKSLPWPLAPLPWCPSGFQLQHGVAAGKHPYHAAGLYYLQEPSAMAVAEAASVSAGDLILDLAAAPGGKSSHLAALTNDVGLLVSNEVNAKRCKALLQNLERCGIRHALVVNERVERLAEVWGGCFDKVLLDAPCSGEGMFRKNDEALAMWTDERVAHCARLQDRLLDDAASLVKGGGRLVYSTCTFSPEENEWVVAKFLKRWPAFQLRQIGLEGLAPGRPDWLPEDLKRDDLHKTRRIWPHLHPGEGHFIAAVERISGPIEKLLPFRAHNTAPDILKLWQQFVGATLLIDPARGKQIVQYGDHLYAIPPLAPFPKGLKIRRIGLRLASIRGKRLLPSHALVMALRPVQVRETLSFEPQHPELLRYLQGHPIEHRGNDGWLAIAVGGHCLSWGRRAKGIVKNAYPKGLRRR
ncbi:MAG: RsmF rRNA methyltransferase first C-terminal domain-containing protein [Trueperaceae bacterium]|nr:MAG: RsmF rRNA methyltransferase first C-terminal domain-containing protein [Trueperaceae bacterium]